MAILLANAGTPLMWFTLFHLVVGNALIGWFEGVLLAHLFKARRARTIPCMIAAYYLSMLIGAGLRIWWDNDLIEFTDRRIDLSNVAVYLTSLAAIAFVLSLLIEWPFCIPRSIARCAALDSVSGLRLWSRRRLTRCSSVCACSWEPSRRSPTRSFPPRTGSPERALPHGFISSVRTVPPSNGFD